jgi:hypothetical protein
MEFTVALPPGESAGLVCTTWGTESGPMALDLHADGRVVTAVPLGGSSGMEFHDVMYPLGDAPEPTARLRFESTGAAGRIFGCRIVRNPEALTR